MSKDFFDEEYEKMEKEKEEQREESREKRKKELDEWYRYFNSDNDGNNGGSGSGGGSGNGADGGSGSGGGSGNGGTHAKTRPWFIALLCVTVVMAIVFGWVLCAIFGNAGTVSTTVKVEQTASVKTIAEKVCQALNEGKSEDQKVTLTDAQIQQITAEVSQAANDDKDYLSLLANVFDYLRNYYYKDISEDKWQTAVAAAGTALLQSAGDKYCQLMSPLTYYKFNYSMSGASSLSTGEGIFGMRYSFSEKLGMYISDVIADSSCYGLLQSEDIIVKISDITYDDEIYKENNSTFEKVDTMILENYDQQTFVEMFAAVTSANFHCLRDGDVFETGIIERGDYGFKSGYDYTSVDFYFVDAFGKTVTNISTENKNKSKHNTKELLSLDQLPSNTGYIHLKDFTINASSEFSAVMSLFKDCGLKRLVLDLKGNGGGYIQQAVNIAGMLVTDSKLSATDKLTVRQGSELLISTLTDKDGNSEIYRTQSSYSKYFDEASDICDIVIWTDGNSASASELLTGALLEDGGYGTGFQIGTLTYGKGIAQTCSKLPYRSTYAIDDSGKTYTGYWWIYYTFAKYSSPFGKNIHGIGYTPEEGYDGITDYAELWQATKKYWAQ